MTEPFYGRKPEDGLHILKDEWKQKEYLGIHSKALAEEESLAAAINATLAAAPERLQGFRLNRPLTEAIHESEQERRLETAMMKRWGCPGMGPIPGGWERLVAFQVPLFDQQRKQGWGYIDLLGVDTRGAPVVVELKKAPESDSKGKTKGGTETPLRMVLEAATYAIALRKNWERFRSEWLDRLMEIGVSDQILTRIPEVLEAVSLVAAAPASFWIDWLPITEKGRTIRRETWVSFQALLVELEKAKLPVSFVSISGFDQDVTGLAVQPLPGFPLIC